VNRPVAHLSAHAGFEAAPAAELEAALPVRRWALPAAWARRAEPWLPVAPGARDAVAARDVMARPQAAERAGAAPPAVRGVAEVALRAERVWGAEPRQEAAAVWAGVVLRQEARDAAGVLLRAAPGAPVEVLPSAERPSGAAWVCHRDRVRRQGRPVPSPAVRFARAMARLRIASPSELSWQAARAEILSCWFWSPEKY
jgi:hypothetical protein